MNEDQAHRIFDAAEVRIRYLEAELSKAQDDAERYRWLRGGGERVINKDASKALMAFRYWCTPDELDAAIDNTRIFGAQP